ncbi:MAG: helix-turn-helix transcriptional regulator [Desulfobacterales bacterium]|nr:helix-turn-helix transcriptional regulator [Desulfobacterales bacterium]
MTYPGNKDEQFAIRVFNTRKRLGLSQLQLAKKIGASKGTIQNYEAGSLPRGEYAIGLAEVFNCSIDWLLTGKEKEADKQNLPSISIEYQDIIKQFYNPATGKKINEQLVVIQKNEKIYQGIINLITAAFETVKAIEDSKSDHTTHPGTPPRG